ncbi:F-box/kelch-repeat protein At1g57790-like [Papaver somniferum]|uniref:F-box/kelch-repeat protein At1g57790-like n=1 Tax=Papaver somniferum TaxID=3469 RepID=UPI000E6FA056|nr:F-box/kelch-repeat protein At1g57790-like [Papaver somniferum]
MVLASVADDYYTSEVDDRRTADCNLEKVEHMDEVIKVMENIAGRDDEKEDTEKGRLGIMPIDDLVWSVSNYLHTLDYIHLRAVSKRYRAMMNLRRSSSIRTFKTTDLSPWLVFSDYDRSIYNFVNPLHNNEKYLISIPEMVKGSRICFSKGGWLLMVNGLTLFFHNPFTRSGIKLPDFPNNRGAPFSGISFSSLPTSADCVVFAIKKQLDASMSIFFIKRGEEHWRCDSFDATSYLPLNRKQMGFEMDLNNPVFYNGVFYCLDINGNLGVSKQENDNVSWEVLAMVSGPNCGFIYKSYLVECEGKLLCVLLGHLGKWVRIFRLNDTQMVWVEVKDLGRHMLCVSNTSSISAVAPVSQMENKIYFPRLHEDGILFYSLDTGMYHCVGTTKHSAKDYRDTKVKLFCSWIEPNWSETSVKSLDWLSI